ncbi:MAG: response regulator, partial [Fimbriimonadaceae bacterium]|nr:response regulator [Chitinophagales bacterium]
MKVNPHKDTINVLLADDDKDDRYFFDKALKQIPIATHLKTVADGEKLMDYLLKNDVPLPDVLFLDLNMPRKNGSECLAEIKRNEKLKEIPV